MSDERLRALERRFAESGSVEDEAAYFLARVRAGKIPFLNGNANQLALVILNRLVQAGLGEEVLAKMMGNQALIEQITELARNFRPEPTGEYANEEVESNYAYPEGFRIRTVEEQLAIWQELCPELDGTHVAALANGRLPSIAEGWGVIPKPSRLGGYHSALEQMLSVIAARRDFENYRVGQTGPAHLRLIARTREWLARLERDQPDDFMVFPFQFGLRHRGRSVQRARVCFTQDEVGLGPYEVACLLVTHPDRIRGYDQLHGIDCAGCEYRDEPSGAFPWSMSFRWLGRLRFARRHVDPPNGPWGSASGFDL